MVHHRLSFLQRSPVLLAAFAFMAGILIAQAHWRPAGWLLADIAAAIACALVSSYRDGRYALVAALTASLALGAFAAQVERYHRGTQATLQPFTDNLLYTITGHVVHAGMLRVQNGEARQSVDIETEGIDRYEDRHAISSGIRLTIYGAEDMSAVPYGARLQFDAQLREPLNFKNPGDWDYRGWLARQGITALANAAIGNIEFLPGFTGSRAGLLRYRARRSLLEHMHRLAQNTLPWGWLRFSDDDGALLEAMTIGERTELGQETRLEFQRTGAFHLLVVSGMNIAIFTVVVFWAARRIGFADVGATLLTAAFAIAYATLTDLGAPIMRATVMALVFLAARFLYRQSASANAIGAAALVVLAVDPGALFEASFQMTFLSVLAILVIIGPLLECSLEKYARGLRQLGVRHYDFAFPPEIAQFRLDLRLLLGRVARLVGRPQMASVLVIAALRGAFFVAEVLLLSAIMQCVMALPTAIYFHRITWAGLATNSLVVPLMELLMPVACIALAASYGPGWLVKLPSCCAAIAIHAIAHVVRVLGGLRFAEARVARSGHLGHCRRRSGIRRCLGRCRIAKIAADPAGWRRHRCQRGPASVAPCFRPSARTAGDHRDRCGPGRFSSDHYSRRQKAADRCGRPHGRIFRFVVRLWRRRGLALSLASRHRAARCGSHHPRALRSYAGHSQRHLPISSRMSSGSGSSRTAISMIEWSPPPAHPARQS